MPYNLLILESPGAKITATMFVIHGLGHSAYTMKPFVERLLEYNEFKHIRFILPDSTLVKMTARKGKETKSWFDIYDFMKFEEQDHKGAWKAASNFRKLIKDEIELRKIPPSRIVVSGFSQGAGMAYMTTASLDIKIRALLSLSGFIPVVNSFATDVVNANKSTPMLHCHGNEDNFIFLDIAKYSLNLLRKNGFKNITYKEYDGLDHSFGRDDEFQDVCTFLKKMLPPINAEEKSKL